MTDMERKLQVFRRALPMLLQGGLQGKYALIHGDAVDSFWDTVDAALTAGYERFGLEPFLVQHITEREKPRFLLAECGVARACPRGGKNSGAYVPRRRLRRPNSARADVRTRTIQRSAATA